MSILKKISQGVLGLIGSFLTFSHKYQMSIQSFILWVMAIVNFGSDRFWLFAIPAILFSGMSAIIDELKTLNNK